MAGWQRLKLILSLVYWAGVGVLVLISIRFVSGANEAIGLILLAAIVVYGVVAAIWWAFPRFRGRP